MFKIALLSLCFMMIIACSKASKDRKLSTSAGKGKVKTVELRVYGVSTDKVSDASIYLTDFDKAKKFQALFVQKENNAGERVEKGTDKVSINLTSRKISKKKTIISDKQVYFINKDMNLNVKIVKLDPQTDFDSITIDFLKNYNPAVLVSQINFDDEFNKEYVNASLKEKHIEFDHRRKREISASSTENMDDTSIANLIENMRDEENSDGSIFWVSKTIPLKNKNEKRVLSYVVKLEQGFNEMDKGKLKENHLVRVSYKVLKSELVNGK
ncbi:hypothetical protein N9N67_03290 [Bacteriovoracaceae bacterium]|nr:hypothetical protein [Bacteriovoracaceae bacterium]